MSEDNTIINKKSNQCNHPIEPSIDYFSITGSNKYIPLIQAKLSDLYNPLIQCNQWENSKPSSTLYTKGMKEFNTGIKISYTPNGENKDIYGFTNRFQCSLKGSHLRFLKNVETVNFISDLNNNQQYEITRIDLKIRLHNPSFNIPLLLEMSGIEAENKQVGISRNVCGFNIGEYYVKRETDYPERSIYFGGKDSSKRLKFYDSRRHGINNALDIELTLRKGKREIIYLGLLMP